MAKSKVKNPVVDPKLAEAILGKVHDSKHDGKVASKAKTRRKRPVKASKPSSQTAWESDLCRCFYCKSLLLITDTSNNYAVCSANCPSRLVVVSNYQKCRIRRAWHWQASLDKRFNPVSKECESVSSQDT